METPERLARNEDFFRSVNERIQDVADRFGADTHYYEFICECADPNCVERIPLTSIEYETIRSDPRHFVLAPGHEVRAIEMVVEAQADHVVVEKVGAAGDVAEALDPRAA